MEEEEQYEEEGEEEQYEEEGEEAYEEEEEGAWETCTAIGDWNGENEGDLAFATGDTIYVYDRVSDPSGWWTGEFNEVQGSFPSTYVQLNQ